MNKTPIHLTIEKLAGLGDGMGMYEGRKIFVPYSCAGDKLMVERVKTTSEADYARIIEIKQAGKERITPVCRHFGICGGCSLQHIDKQRYIQFKTEMAQMAIRKAGFDIIAEPLVTIPSHSRRRTELKMVKGQLGYYEAGSNRIVDIEACHVLTPELFAFIQSIKPALLAVPEITAVHINQIDNRYDLVLEAYNNEHKKLEKTGLFAFEAIQRISFLVNKKIYIIHSKPHVSITLSGIKVPLPPQAFLQAAKIAEEKMVELVCGYVKDSHNVLDLFSGLGTYSFALTKYKSVTAIEGSHAMVKAMKMAAKSRIMPHPFTPHTRDLFLSPLEKPELEMFDSVIINPPKMGAKAQCEQLARSNVSKIVMISCNPATFARDARILKEGGYELKNLTPIDQFTYSSHLELVAYFTK